jgi:hypothetical protein
VSQEIVFNLTIDPKDPSLLIANNKEYRYSQAKIYGDTLRYYKAGVQLEHIDADIVELALSVKIGSKSDLIKRSGRKYCVKFNAKLVSILFKGTIYDKFSSKIEFELLDLLSCEVDNKTGGVVITGFLDPKLDMQTFEIGYPLGQPTLVND